MARDYEFQHYVPRTYLEAWHNKDGKLKVYKKGTESHFFRSPNSILGENDYYTINTNSLLALNEKDKEEIFGMLNNYSIKLDGERLRSIDEYVQNYYRFDEWCIRNLHGENADKQILKETIDSKRILDIEKGWQNFENDWKQIREEIIKTIEDRTYNLDINVSAKIINYIASQKFRNNTKKDEYREIIDSLFNFFKESMTDSEYDQIVDEFTSAYFLKSVRRFQGDDKNSVLIKEQELMKQLHIVLYTAVQKKKFLTSDNPVFLIQDKKFYKGKYSGLYFPITPNVLLALYKGDTYTYTRSVMPTNMLRRVNRRIIENSNRFYIKVDDDF